MKINESSAKINTIIFYVLSAPEYRSEDLFFYRSLWFWEKKVKDEIKALFFSREHQFLEILALGP